MQTSHHSSIDSQAPQTPGDLSEEEEAFRSSKSLEGHDQALDEDDEPEPDTEEDDEIGDSERAKPSKKDDDLSEPDHQDDGTSDDDGEPDIDSDVADSIKESDKVLEEEGFDDDPDNGNEDRPGTVIAD